jgi:hypothetical protein
MTTSQVWLVTFQDGAYELTAIGRTKYEAIGKIRAQTDNHWAHENDEEFRCVPIDTDNMLVEGQAVMWR